VLPPDVVCLYSEDRKFFLHGALYCALASALGAGKSVAQLVRELGKDFPADKIREALKRLADRRFVVPAPRSSANHADAYWASLGLLPDDAKRNLQKCRVCIQSIDVKGAKELSAALKALGVRIVKGPADLTVTLVSDYLEPQLAELNPAAFVGSLTLAARPALGHFFPWWGRCSARATINARARAGAVSPSA
jgi:ribosomal protein S12 methylthiotransferase accessory factor